MFIIYNIVSVLFPIDALTKTTFWPYYYETHQRVVLFFLDFVSSPHQKTPRNEMFKTINPLRYVTRYQYINGNCTNIVFCDCYELKQVRNSLCSSHLITFTSWKHNIANEFYPFCLVSLWSLVWIFVRSTRTLNIRKLYSNGRRWTNNRHKNYTIVMSCVGVA